MKGSLFATTCQTIRYNSPLTRGNSRLELFTSLFVFVSISLPETFLLSFFSFLKKFCSFWIGIYYYLTPAIWNTVLTRPNVYLDDYLVTLNPLWHTRAPPPSDKITQGLKSDLTCPSVPRLPEE